MTIEQLASALSLASAVDKMLKDIEIDLSHLGTKIVFDYNPKDKVYIYKRYNIDNDFKLVAVGAGVTTFVAWANRVFKNDNEQKFNELKQKYEDILDIANVRISFDQT